MLAIFQYQKLIEDALQEDIGTGDLSSFVIPEDQNGIAKIYAKKPGVVCGLPILIQIFKILSSDIEIRLLASDGDQVNTGDIVAIVSGPVRYILQGERTALNLIQHLSGISTRTRDFVNKVEGLPVAISDTRKTLPGLRLLQKYAVRIGGGRNHRFGLYDAIMLKDNHIAAAGGIKQAILAAKAIAGHAVKIEVECETLEQVKEAAENNVDIIMLDNMSIDQMREAVDIVGKRAIVEASGGITEEGIRQIAETGVDVISIGALTHSVKALDFSLDIGEIKESTRLKLGLMD